MIGTTIPEHSPNRKQMQGWRSLLGALNHAFPSSRSGRLVRRLYVMRPLTILWLVFAALLVFALFWLYGAWQSAQSDLWYLAWCFVGLAMLAGLALLASASAPTPPNYAADVDAELRQPAAQGDPTRAPQADPQPEPVYAIGATALRVFPGIRLDAVPQTNWVSTGIAAFSIVSNSVIAILRFVLHLTEHKLGWLDVLMASAILALLVALVVVIVITERWHVPYQCVADEQGLTIRQGHRGKGRMIPWHEVRGFWMLHVPRSWIGQDSSDQPLYVLDDGAALWNWTPPKRPNPYKLPRPRLEDDPAWQLCQIVAARTHRPLLDLTERATALADQFGAVQRRPPWHKRFAWMRVRPATSPQARLAPLAPLLVIALTITSVFASVNQGRTYIGWLTTIEASTPLLADPLRAEAGILPMRNQTYDFYSYTNDGLVFGRDGINTDQIEAWSAATYADVTVAVTVRIADEFEIGTAGLILRGDDASHTALLFAIDRTGDWYLYRENLGLHPISASLEETALASNHSDAITWDPYAANQLTVTMRGATYILYINGQFVGIYRDAPGAATTGHIGLYAEAWAIDSATFSDLAVYPAPPPPWGLDLWLPSHPPFG